MNKTIKLFSAVALLLAAAGAYASSDDGTSDQAWLQQHPISQQAPAPVSASAPGRNNQARETDSGVISPTP